MINYFSHKYCLLLHPLDVKYAVNDGAYDNGQQTTTLLVDGTLNTQDTAYTCVITPADGESDTTEKSITVNLDVYSK